MTDQDPVGPILVLAPHLEFPTRIGDDILIDGRWSAVSRHVQRVDVLGAAGFYRYTEGRVETISSFANRRRSRTLAAMRTLAIRSHYLREAHLTTTFRRHAAGPLRADMAYAVVVSSYYFTAELVLKELSRSDRSWSPKLLVAESHNDEFQWYKIMRAQTLNPLVRLVARQSQAWMASFLRAHAPEFTHLHVTDQDRRGYEEVFGPHDAIIAPVGINDPLVDRSLADGERAAGSGPARLAFVGSLNVLSNRAALEIFEDEFQPLIRRRIGESLEVLIAGSNPGRDVILRAKMNGWRLHANVTDDRLHQLIASSTATILPFRFSTGAKLKVLESLILGVPVMATSAIAHQLPPDLPGCLISDSPEEWSAHLESLQRNPLSLGQRNVLREHARLSSWEAQASGLVEQLASRITRGVLSGQ